MKLELLTNATLVDDAIRFVSDRSKDKENLKSSAATIMTVNTTKRNQMSLIIMKTEIS
jgi:hypothetical protein